MGKIPKNLGDALEIERYKKGECFICRHPTELTDAYVHGHCALAYLEDKERRIKDADGYTQKVG